MNKFFTILFAIMTSIGLPNTMADSSVIKRVEPSNWWVGMKNPSLQILVYGTHIADYNVTMDKYQGVKLNRVEKTDNPNYLFVYLDVTAKAKAGNVALQFNKGNDSFTFEYPLWNRRQGSAMRQGFNSEDVFYLIMPDRFANGNPANDSHPDVLEKANRADMNGRHGGDLQGIIDHLDYLQDLGVTAIWNTPVQEDNMPVCSYHQYATSDYYKIDPRFGTNEDYARLSAEAQKRGIKIVMDVVTNHCGSAHWWMNDRPSADWFHPQQYCNFQAGAAQDPYVAPEDKRLNFEGWFDGTMPDLRQEKPLLLDYLTQVYIWWIEYADLGGLRIDTYPYNYPAPMQDFNARIIAEYPHLNIMGEVWVHSPSDVAYWQKDADNADGFNSQLPTVMDFPLNEMLTLFASDGDNNGMMHLYDHFRKDYLYANPNNLLVFTDNHDTQRIAHIEDENPAGVKMAIALTATVRGIPQFYYGGEILMTGEKTLGDGDIRRDMPGGWPGDTINAFTADGRTAEQNDVFNFMRSILQWRKNAPAIHSGKTMHYAPKNGIYTYFRYNDKDTVMVVLNNRNEAQNLSLDRFSDMLKNHSKAVNIINNETISLEKEISVPAKTALILEIK